MLFGQGAGASAGGALGGAAGGLLGGQFGFALSLVGTQLGSLVDNLVSSTAALGRAIGPQQADAGQTVAAQKQQAADQEKLNQALLKLENRSLDNIGKKVELRNKEVAQGKKLVSEAGNRRKILMNNNKLRTQEFRTAGKTSRS